MKCADLAANLGDFLDGVLPAEIEAAALEHLATCPQCEIVLAGTRAVITLGAQYGKIELNASERRAILDGVLGFD